MARERATQEAVALAARSTVNSIARVEQDAARMRRGKRPKIAESEARKLLKHFPDQAMKWFSALQSREGIH
jgi:hypothetical protein